MGRRLLVTALAASVLLVLVGSAAAAPRTLWPGVTFATTVQFTTHGPVALNVLTGPRPGGTTTLTPLLSNETLTGRETLTAMERRTAASGTTAGVNGDFFTLDSGLPSGILMRDGQLASPPSDARSSAGILTDGTLDVRRVTFVGTWQASGARRTLGRYNRPFAGAGSTALYTDAWGPSTPAVKGATAVTIFPFPAAIPNSDLQAPVVAAVTANGPVAIPPGGAVLVATGAAAAALTAEAPLGQLLTVRLLFKPDWPDVVSAIGGGPQIVRDGKAIFRAGELFSTGQLAPRSARSAVGQLADGRIVLVAVDGQQPGYSVGASNFELAQALVRLGAVTAMAFDSGGSTTMAFDGSLLNRPSGPERPISTALAFLYTGVYVRPAVAVVSPDGDGVGDRQSLRYRLVRPSTVTVQLTAPDGTVAFAETAAKGPGSYGVPFPPTPLPAASASPSSRTAAARVDAPAQGRWTLTVAATDDVGQPSEMSQSFVVNSTVGYLSTLPAKLYLPPYGRTVRIRWRQGAAARVVVTIESRDGVVLRTLATRRYAPGSQSVSWDGLDRTKKAVKGGMVVVHVVAKNELGTLDLSRNLRVQRIVGAR